MSKKFGRENSYQDETIARRSFWIVLVSAFIQLYLIGSMFYFLITVESGFSDQPLGSYGVLVGYIIAFGSSIWAYILIRRGQALKGLYIAYYANFLIVIANTVFYEGREFSDGLALGLVALITIMWAFPRDERRWPIISLVIFYIWLFVWEFIDPPFRQPLTAINIETYPIIGAILAILVVLLLIREGWSGNIRLKFITVFTATTLILLSIIGFIFINFFQNQIRQDTRKRLTNMVSIAALQQDGDLHATIQNPGDENTKAFQQLKAVNSAIVATEPEINSIYTMRIDDQGQIQFFVDAGQPGVEADELASVAEVYEDPPTLMINSFATL